MKIIKTKSDKVKKRTQFIAIALLLLMVGCKNVTPVKKESWMDKPLSQWPTFALTNEISFRDTTYKNLANAFLVNTGYDTLAVSCKHIFMVFEYQLGFTSIDLGKRFNYWKMYPKNDTAKSVWVKQLINTNSHEIIGQFNTLKVRDWILFKINKNHKGLYPLKIRYTPVKREEVVYAYGWGSKQKDNSRPKLIKLQCYDNYGDYFYTRTLSRHVNFNGRSGSPVIDKNGYLVGIASGAEGKLGVMGSVKYLKKMFDTYHIKYKDPAVD